MPQAVLMAGGLGTRLRPITAVLPKPLVPIGEISILELVLRQLKYFGFDKIVISVGHKSELIMAVVGDGSKWGLEVRYHCEEKPLGTVGALAEISGLEEDFLVMNGDICTNLDFMKFFRYHQAHGEPATVGSYNRVEKIELGVLELDSSGSTITDYREKPQFNFWVSMGVYAFNRKVVKMIPVGQFFTMDKIIKKLLKFEYTVKLFKFRDRWLDIGRPDDYEKMLNEFESDKAIYLPEGA